MTVLHGALARCRMSLYAVFCFSIVVNILMLTVALYMLQVYDRILSSESTETLIYLTIVAVSALAVLGVFEMLRSRVLVRMAGWLDRVLSPHVFERGLDNALVGRAYRTDSLRDLHSLKNFLTGSGITALFDAPWVPIYLGVIYLLHPTLGHFALAGAVMLVLLALVNDRRTRAPLGQANAARADAMRGAEAAFRNAEVVDGMGMGRTIVRRWSADNAHVLAAQEVASDKAGTFTAISKSLRLMLQVGILGLGAWLVLRAEITPGGMIAASIILGRALAPVDQSLAAWRQVSGARDSWGRLTDLLSQPPLHPASMRLPRPEGRLEVEQVSYAPPGAELPVIKEVSLKLDPGEVLAIVGSSAAGKSTLARLMVGIGQPQIGRVRLDGADVCSLCRETFAESIGYLPQDVELFPGTIRENIARMENGDPEAIVAAARIADVHEMILRLPNGYDTELDERCALLSAGQRQRIGLARALYGEPVLLVLDEPNSNLDEPGERALNHAILKAKQMGATIVVVAHRPSLMSHVDKVAVLCDGRLELFGEQPAVLARLQHRARPRPVQRTVGPVAQGV